MEKEDCKSRYEDTLALMKEKENLALVDKGAGL